MDINSYLYFSFRGDFFDTTELTNILNIQPTSVMIKKDLIPKSNSWNYHIDAGNDLDLEKHLDQLVQIFDSKIEIINRVKKEQNLENVIQFVIDIDTHPESSTPYFILNHKVIEFLYNTGTEMDYDLYKYDSRE
jgi:hypothetical protein